MSENLVSCVKLIKSKNLNFKMIEWIRIHDPKFATYSNIFSLNQMITKTLCDHFDFAAQFFILKYVRLTAYCIVCQVYAYSHRHKHGQLRIVMSNLVHLLQCSYVYTAAY